jgi:hypothetical protein
MAEALTVSAVDSVALANETNTGPAEQVGVPSPANQHMEGELVEALSVPLSLPIQERVVSCFRKLRGIGPIRHPMSRSLSALILRIMTQMG